MQRLSTPLITGSIEQTLCVQVTGRRCCSVPFGGWYPTPLRCPSQRASSPAAGGARCGFALVVRHWFLDWANCRSKGTLLEAAARFDPCGFEPATSASRTTTFLNTHLHNPDNASTRWAEVTDPTEPLFGKRLPVERVASTPQDVAHVFLRRDDGIILRVPLRATNLSTLVRHSPEAKLCKLAVQELLDLVKEYEQCTQKAATKPGKSGPHSNKPTRNKS